MKVRAGAVPARTVGGRMFRSATLGLAFVLAAAAMAASQTAEEQALCQDDAFRLCSQTIPDRERTFQCMITHRAALSAPCRAVMARLLSPRKSTTRRVRKGQGSGPASLSPTAER